MLSFLLQPPYDALHPPFCVFRSLSLLQRPSSLSAIAGRSLAHFAGALAGTAEEQKGRKKGRLVPHVSPRLPTSPHFVLLCSPSRQACHAHCFCAARLPWSFFSSLYAADFVPKRERRDGVLEQSRYRSLTLFPIPSPSSGPRGTVAERRRSTFFAPMF